MINLCKSDQNYTERDIVFTLLSKNGFVSSCYFTFILKKETKFWLAISHTFFYVVFTNETKTKNKMVKTRNNFFLLSILLLKTNDIKLT